MNVDKKLFCKLATGKLASSTYIWCSTNKKSINKSLLIRLHVTSTMLYEIASPQSKPRVILGSA